MFHPDVLFENLHERSTLLGQYCYDQTGDRKNRAPGFPELPRFSEQYELVAPYEEVKYKIWPLLLRCTNEDCEKVAFFKDDVEWGRQRTPPAATSAAGHASRCPTSRCMSVATTTHCSSLAARNTTWNTSTSRTSAPSRLPPGAAADLAATVATSRNMRFQPCGCGEGGGYVSRTIRQEDTGFLSRHSPSWFRARSATQARAHPGRGEGRGGLWLGLPDDYEQALLDAQNEPNADAAAKWPEMERMMREYPPLATRTSRTCASASSTRPLARLMRSPASSPHLFARKLAAPSAPASAPSSGQAPATSAAGVWRTSVRLPRTPAAYGAAQVLADAEQKLEECGFSDLLVVGIFL